MQWLQEHDKDISSLYRPHGSTGLSTFGIKQNRIFTAWMHHWDFLEGTVWCYQTNMNQDPCGGFSGTFLNQCFAILLQMSLPYLPLAMCTKLCINMCILMHLMNVCLYTHIYSVYYLQGWTRSLFHPCFLFLASLFGSLIAQPQSVSLQGFHPLLLRCFSSFSVKSSWGKSLKTKHVYSDKGVKSLKQSKIKYKLNYCFQHFKYMWCDSGMVFKTNRGMIIVSYIQSGGKKSAHRKTTVIELCLVDFKETFLTWQFVKKKKSHGT